MSQPPFQPPPQPPQPPQQPPQPQQAPNAYNPYAQPAPPQQPPGFGAPPVPGQPSMQPGQPSMHGGQPPIPGQAPTYPAPPYQAPPFGQRPNAGGHPVGAVFLGFFVSVIVSLLYSGLILATYKDQTTTVSNTLYFAHALINGAIVGALIGAVGHRSTGAWTWGAVIAALGAFFGYANALPLIIAENQGGGAVWDMVRYEPFFPAKAWWNDEANGGVDWFSPLGLLVAAGAAWGLAYLVGNKRRQA